MPTRVLVVEDSLTIRRRMVEILEADPEVVVVGEAADGQRAIELCQRLRPDVISLDMMMPGLSGLAVTEHVMAYLPTPILIVSASTNRGELHRTYDALAAGAIDVLEKPRGDDSDDAWARQYVSALKLIARIKVIRHPRARLGAWGRPPTPGPVPEAVGASRTLKPAMAAVIGGSTGAPGAMADILRSLPRTFPLPILLVLHVAPPFEAALPGWLADRSRLEVAYANDGDGLPRAGQVVMAPAERHLVVRGGRLRLTRDPERHSCRPSVDVLFESVAQELGGAAVGCLLTGMGRDGAEGLLAIRRAGGFTIAQDEATSVVFGMPKEAIALGAADRVLPLGSIAAALTEAAVAGRVER
jgi:two-component system chemotaxis response regulator CheB